MRRLLRTLVLLALGAAVTAGAAYAAGLGVSSGRLTVVSSAASVPLSECVRTADADTYAAQLLPLSGFGTAGQLGVRSELLANQRSFVRFASGPCAIPADARIRSATLELVVTAAPGIGRTYGVHRATQAWTEGGLTWATQPAIAAATTTAVVGATGVVSWNVQSDVAAFVAGSTANEGWAVRDEAEGAVVAQASTFASRESGSGPTLRITYYP
jgi:hypothetical protein